MQWQWHLKVKKEILTSKLILVIWCLENWQGAWWKWCKNYKWVVSTATTTATGW